MSILDCSTLDTTYDSLAAILQLPSAYLRKWIANLDPDSLAGGDVAVWHAFRECQPISIDPNWNATVFFHFTRTIDPTAFKRKGLLPLTAPLLDLIWKQLHDLARNKISQSQWIQFKRNVENEPGSTYKLKTNPSSVDVGPLGFPIRELAFHPSKIHHHDYLDLPEIVEDISMCGEDNLGLSLAELFRQKATSCIVKFRVDIAEEKYLATALAYAFARVDDSWWYATTIAYDARGQVIPPSHIIHVECPPDPMNV